VLITTPESLHLLLTSRGRETLRGVTHCIIDEIHALCPNKRGVFLVLLLERLRAITATDFVRIGLSATQRRRFLARGGVSIPSEAESWRLGIVR
jgi:ATP-dependent Lhr-like helicase